MNEHVEEGASNLGALFVDRLLARHQIAPRQRQQFVADALGLTYQQARRRMLGSPPFTLEELQSLGERFAEPLERVVSSDNGAEEPASLVFGSVRLDCRAIVGDEAKEGRSGPLVATRPMTGQLLLVPASEALRAKTYEVKRLVFEPDRQPAIEVAVLDGDADLANSIADYMIALGVGATAFFASMTLEAAIKKQAFDGYVIDWMIDGGRARELIQTIRVADPDCPIVLLAAQIEEGKGEQELAAIASSYRLSYFEKPIRTSSIMSTLQLGLAKRRAA